MPFHLVGYDASPASASLTNIAALTDPSMTVSGNNITIPPGLDHIVGSFALAAAITRGQLQSPNLRELTQQEIGMVNVGATPQVPSRWNDWRMDPRILRVGEAMQAAVIDAAAEHASVFAWLADAPIQPVTPGEIFTVRATGTTTLVAFAWTNGALTFDQNLPAGTYNLVGARARSTGLIAFRFVFVGTPFRPGGPGAVAVSDIMHPAFRYGGMGVWGSFTNIQPPTVDFFSGSADTAETLELDLVQISTTPTGF